MTLHHFSMFFSYLLPSCSSGLHIAPNSTPHPHRNHHLNFLLFFFFGLALFLDKRNFWNKIVDRQFGYVCSFYRCQFDPVNGGEMTQLEYHNFLKPEAAF
jgi:hypothetical protein